ncbi:DegT/DnrJ/EryC1/StrS family aminotransferase [Natronolimnohabitans innermongolicus]|uniref:Glutamine--scyllo-inositol transaminase n=1 Tax=Natronolimnohabitans innermongolicus JCM 12255 TaxID=1227499 RepID=L9WHC7_9EURY|nr:DegT/DnrJ/EryC1/StrS family aminotransferase [Natronolimnohabitans innermongolicus]ELY48910.1 glutamine--scyllo-inositol transaminase [Natronolimnohabitans innermongolicus JCM 12255]
MTEAYDIATGGAFPEKAWVLTEIERMLDGETNLTMGDHCDAFEREFAAYVGREHGIVTNSCTSALETVFRTLDVRGEDVIVPVQTFAANATSVLSTGGELRFADIEPHDHNVSVESVRERISDDTAAVVVVHFAGNVCNRTAELRDLCEEHDAVLIEDCSHAHGARIDGKPAGSIGHVACFSFYATKVMTAGEGGMILTDDREFAREAAAIRNRGLDPATDDSRFEFVGSNYRLSEMAAVLGRSQLPHVDEFVAHRNDLADVYDDVLSDLADRERVRPVSPPANVRSSYWRYPLALENGRNRPRIRDRLREDGIPIDWAYDPPLHRQPFVTDRYDTDGVAPNAESAMGRHICLPIHRDLSVEDAKYIGERVDAAIREMETATANR